MRFFPRPSCYLFAFTSLATIACGGTDTGPTDTGVGGAGIGGAITGGAANSNGGAAVGGSLARGGTASSSGGAPNGGAQSAGGVVAGGASNAVGSASSAGGNVSVGGSRASGGSSNAQGGAQSSGGRVNGGATSAGGRVDGGASTAGGTVSSSGGATQAGGAAPSSGGALASGGTKASGGATTSGGSTSGGMNATGGTTAAGGSTGQLTPQQAVKLMAPGWNLGNSFDAIPNETSWGNPTPTQTLINAVHAAGFKTMRIAVTWSDHIGAGPAYAIDAAWMNKVKQTAQWAIDAGMYVFVNTHHEADGGGWVSFPSTTSAAQTVAAEVTAVWTQIANTFKSFDSRLMLECFNEPSLNTGNNTQTRADLNVYLEACYKSIRGTGGANASRIIMIQPIGASPMQAGIQAMQTVSFINDPNIVISLHTYYPTNFGLSTTPYAWGSATDYTNMRNSVQQIRSWLPNQVIFVGEWGSMGAQPLTNRAAHAKAYSQDLTAANIVPVWWDNGGSGSGSFALFNRSSGAQTMPTIISGIMTGVQNGLASANNWAVP